MRRILGKVILSILGILLIFSGGNNFKEVEAAGNFIYPLEKYIITGKFGDPRSNGPHLGIDMDVAGSGYQYNVPVYASAGGTVRSSYVGPSYGEVVFIEHKINGVTYETRYAHLHPNSRTVKPGDTVKQGQRIGYMGNTGDSTSQHLHFEIRKNGTAVNPLNYLCSSCVPDAGDDWRIPQEKPSDDNYYRVMTGLFNNVNSYQKNLEVFKTKYPYVIYGASDEAKLLQDGELRFRFYTGRIQGANNAQIFKEALEERFSWNFHIVDAERSHESLIVKQAGDSETERYRVMTGYFDNLKSFNNAKALLDANYSSVIYVANDDSNLHQDGDFRLRFYTGYVTGRTAAEKLKADLERKFPWNFHIVEATITSK